MIKIRWNKFCFSSFLTRDFIYDRLYHKDDGYFTKKENIQLGSLK